MRDYRVPHSLFIKIVSLYNPIHFLAINLVVEVWTRHSHHILFMSLQWRHNDRDGVSNHRRLDCLLIRLFWRRSKKISKLHVTGLCGGNSPVTGEFPAHRDNYAENVSIWWRHHVTDLLHILHGRYWGNHRSGSEVTLKDMGKIDWCKTIAKHNESRNVSIRLGIYRNFFASGVITSHSRISI